MIVVLREDFFPKTKEDARILPNGIRFYIDRDKPDIDRLLEILKAASCLVIGSTTNKEATNIYSGSYLRDRNKSLPSNGITLEKFYMDEESSIKALDFDDFKDFDTPDKVYEFVHNTLDIDTMIITPSFSNSVGNNNYKWHVYIPFDKRISQATMKNYVFSKLPKDSFYETLNKAKRKTKKNKYIDRTVFTQGRKFFEDPKNDKFYVYGSGYQNGSKVAASAFEPKIEYVKEYDDKDVDWDIQNLIESKTLDKDTLLEEYGTWNMIKVSDIVENNTSMRFVSLLDMGTDTRQNSMQYFPNTKTFRDYKTDSVYHINMNRETTIEYDTKYAPDFDLSHENTFILSPTGSGKTHQITERMTSNTIFIAPKNSIVDSFRGNTNANILVSLASSESFDDNTKWSDLDPNKLNVMTFDKLSGHIKMGVDLSDWNIVIDEVHILFNSSNETYNNLLTNIIERNKEYKKLLLLSATQKAEYIPIDEIKCFRYINTSRTIHIDFIKNPPVITAMMNNEGRNLVFLQNKELIESMYDTYTQMGKRVLTHYSGRELPDSFEEYDIILTTSALQEGFSIKDTIDVVIVYNDANPLSGASNIIQAIARPRINVPKIYIVSSKTHYEKEGMAIPHPNELMAYASEITDDYTPKELLLIHNLNIDRFKSMALRIDHDTGQNVVDKLGVYSYHNYLVMRNELDDFKYMEENMRYYLNCTVQLSDLGNKDSNRPTKNLKHLKDMLKNARTKEEMDKAILAIEATNSREGSMILNKIRDRLEKAKYSFETNEGIQYLTHEQRIQYIVNEPFIKKWHQHIDNIQSGRYAAKEAQRGRKGLGIYTIRSEKIRYKALNPSNDKIDDEVLGKLMRDDCIFEWCDEHGNKKQRSRATHVRIIHERLFERQSVNPDQKEIDVLS